MEKGRAIEIVTAKSDGTFELDSVKLKAILDPIGDMPVVVVSIAGDFRKGKSFMLNHFLRFLKAGKFNSKWLNSHKDSALEGFKWQRGAEPCTSGIVLWSEPIIVEKDYQDVAVLLMDTLGMFDCNTDPKTNTTIFALSLLISSIQVFNISNNLQEDNLQFLAYFVQYGKLARRTQKDVTPFQNLTILIRDWHHTSTHSFGFDGGKALLENRLTNTSKSKINPKLKYVRSAINDCFSEIDCFLMPHPGENVATCPDTFDGSVEDYGDTFKENLESFVFQLLSPKNLVIKQNAGRELNGDQLRVCIKAFVEIFNGDDLPEPQNILDASEKINNLAAVKEAVAYFTEQVKRYWNEDNPYFEPEELNGLLSKSIRESVQKFEQAPKMGNSWVEFLDQLKSDLDKEKAKLIALNQEKYSSLKNANSKAVNEAKAYFIQQTEPFWNEKESFTAPEELKKRLSELTRVCIEKFEKAPKMGCTLAEFRDQLKIDLEKEQDNLIKFNENKHRMEKDKQKHQQQQKVQEQKLRDQQIQHEQEQKLQEQRARALKQQHQEELKQQQKLLAEQQEKQRLLEKQRQEDQTKFQEQQKRNEEKMEEEKRKQKKKNKQLKEQLEKDKKSQKEEQERQQKQKQELEEELSKVKKQPQQSSSESKGINLDTGIKVDENGVQVKVLGIPIWKF